MSPADAEEKGVFEEDDELDDTEGDDSDMEDDLEDDEEEEEEFPYVSPPPHNQPSRLPKQEPNSPLTFQNPNPNPNPNPNHAVTPARAAPQNGSIKAVPISTSEIFTPPPAHTASAADESRRVVSIEDSRRLFQRLWTDEDEITILQGFLEFTTQRGTTHASHQYDTGPFYEQIKKQLPLEFNKNQLIEKLRRLKKKYRNVVSRMVSGKEFSFKSGHEQATFEIARKIWSANVKRGRDSEDDEFTPNPGSAIVEFDSGFGVGAVVADGSLSSERKLSRSSRRRIRMRNSEQEAAAAAAAAAASVGVAVEVPITAPLDPPLPVPIPSIIEETVKSCLSPLFKELLQSAMVGPQAGLIPGIGGIGGGLGLLGMNPLQLGFGNLQGNLPVDEKWRNQNILELEVYLKRIELMRDQIKSTLEELKSSTPSAGD